jgi:hypothetical protein
MTPETATASFTLQSSEISDLNSETSSLPIFHTVPPPGEYPSKIQLADGTSAKAILVIDPIAYDKILANFNAAAAAPNFPGLLVDREHLSELPAGDSVAAAWVKTIARRDDGLWTGWELTDLGQQLIGGKRFKFRSPVFDLERIAATSNKWRPVKLVSIALTNVPHFKQLAPSLNREQGTQEEHDVDTLLARLQARLNKPDADEAAIYAAIDTALTAGDTAATQTATLKARVAELETADLNRKADDFIKEHGPKVSDTAKLRARFVADPAGTLETVSLLKIEPPPPPARSLGRDGQQETTPETDLAVKRQKQTDAIDTAMSKHRCATRAQAVEFAQAENPDLFKS